MPKEKSVRYSLRQEVLSPGMNSNTRKTYSDAIEKFCGWCDGQGMHHISQVETAGAVETVKVYCEYLKEHGYSASSIHTWLAPVCRGLELAMSDIDTKPTRSIDTITRGRQADSNPQGRREALDPRYERVVALQDAIGVRKAELYRLRGRDLVRDESGRLCVEIERGKGGKHQLQRVPEDEVETVTKIMRSVSPESYVFSRDETKSKINFHGMRAEVQRREYDRCLDKLTADPSFRATMRAELIARYDAENDGSRAGAERARARFIEQVYGKPDYRLRGASKATAEKNGRPIVLDRTAVLYVSVFYGSHWRCDVEVINYLVS